MNTQATEEGQKQTKGGDAQTLFKIPPRRGHRRPLPVALILRLWRSGISSRLGARRTGRPRYRPRPDAGGAVKFLMEQQWRIRMKLALVEEDDCAPGHSHGAGHSPPPTGMRRSPRRSAA